MPRAPSNTGSRICPHCGLRFARNYDLNRHVQGSHERSLRYGCTVCDHTTAQKSNMSQHMKARHRIVNGTPRTIDMRSTGSTSLHHSFNATPSFNFNYTPDFNFAQPQIEAPVAASQTLSIEEDIFSQALASLAMVPSTSYLQPAPAAPQLQLQLPAPATVPQISNSSFCYSLPDAVSNFAAAAALPQLPSTESNLFDDALLWYPALSAIPFADSHALVPFDASSSFSSSSPSSTSSCLLTPESLFLDSGSSTSFDVDPFSF
ncbi:hypothetical protein EXIGLDRAFT_195552 [Exidia glandulosa HHB12029]|uniref:C2H2-type domain-containing protein n=1 Tax=Exidia glandulosa HHB12029 TaxID=1314781 RepID=A0A165EVL9_EXIGL|nr:hypothetical protein EXIGLDRAFT_195552 [Exidia glandulosa HHB12029]